MQPGDHTPNYTSLTDVTEKSDSVPDPPIFRLSGELPHPITAVKRGFIHIGWLRADSHNFATVCYSVNRYPIEKKSGAIATRS